jgi:hypothetical protein
MTQSLAKFEQPKNTTPDVGEFSVMKETATMLCKTGFLPQAIKTPEQAIAIILTGRELGIGTMAALNTINVIQGKPTVSPQLMLALIERSGQLENIEIEPHNGNAIRCTMKRRNRSAHTEYFGETEASAMQLTGKDNYKKQALTMYRWRAVAACARVVFPDVILGLYTPDEMGAEVNTDGEILPPEPLHVVPMSELKAPQIIDVDPDPPTKSYHNPDPFAEKKAIIGNLCRTLNNAGDSIRWGKHTLREYVAEMFEVDGIDDLSLPTLDELIDDLETRVKDLQQDEPVNAV